MKIDFFVKTEDDVNEKTYCFMYTSEASNNNNNNNNNIRENKSSKAINSHKTLCIVREEKKQAKKIFNRSFF